MLVILILLIVFGGAVPIAVMGVYLILRVTESVGATVQGLAGLWRTPAAVAGRSEAGRPCHGSHCRTTNPSHARFCRRCGAALVASAAAAPGRVPTGPDRRQARIAASV